jgi:UDP-N-acetylmuramoylalanine--D-glutamate ligase
VLTAILPDHQDRYGSMEAYVADKRLIYRDQGRGDATVAGDDRWGRLFLGETPARPLVCAAGSLRAGEAGAWLSSPDGPGLARLSPSGPVETVLPPRLLTPGGHQKRNLLAAAAALLDLGLPPDLITDSLGSFPGIEHRLEYFHEGGGVRFYNDTTATIPEAAAAAIDAFETPPVLIAGGTDKNLDFRPLAEAAVRAKALILLAGSGTEKLRALLDRGGIAYRGPFERLEDAAAAAAAAARAGDAVVLSPGCTSFGMFLNEFDRGRRWKDAARRLA